MKKLLMILVMCTVVISSCQKDDPKPDPIPEPIPEIPIEYKMPFICEKYKVVKDSLLKITDEVIEINEPGYRKISCIPTISKDNMFYNLTFEFYYNGFNFEKIIFSYTFDKNKDIKDTDKQKLYNHLKNVKIKI